MVSCDRCGADVDKTYPNGEDGLGYPIMKCVKCIRKEARKDYPYKRGR